MSLPSLKYFKMIQTKLKIFSFSNLSANTSIKGINNKSVFMELKFQVKIL